MTESSLAIGQLATQTGLAVSAIRYYHDIGLIDGVERVGGKRRFHPGSVARVSFVRRSQEAGFSLEEIRAILDDTSGGWRQLVDVKLDELRERRSGLDTMIALLAEIRECGCQAVSQCPIVDAC